jgi:hypothetical protein
MCSCFAPELVVIVVDASDVFDDSTFKGDFRVDVCTLEGPNEGVGVRTTLEARCDDRNGTEVDDNDVEK